MTTPLVTFDSVEAELAKLSRRKRNPIHGDGTCLYTDPRDPKRHCIVGQVWDNLGVRVPPPDYMGDVSSAVDNFGTRGLHAPNLVHALGELQSIADQDSADGRGWGGAIDAWPTIRESYTRVEEDNDE